MLAPTNAASTLVTTAHQAKLAYVYVRQSSLGQVLRHTESTELQYRLVDRAVALGWPLERVRTIDEDLGKSGASAATRPGFQHLIAEVGLARVGLVLSFDASRLARNNRDWYQLLELCSLFGTLLADGERVYDPATYHDRLLLGLSGIMSEAELHHLKQRLHAGAWHKAERGELRLPLPAGLVYLPGGAIGLTPDEEVQARLRLVFRRFHELGTAHAVARDLRAAELRLPVRPLRGPAPHPVRWERARSSTVLAILKNPAYAGAYVYGRSTTEPARRVPGRPHSGSVHRPADQWPIVLQDHHPAYLTWAEFRANQAQLAANQSRSHHAQRGSPRRGQALLQGLAVCGRCGAQMSLHYSGPAGQFPVYKCIAGQREGDAGRCQEVRGLGLDAEVARLLLAALAPDRLALALSALEHWEQEDAVLRQQWALRIERARYEAERARRQFDAVEPEHRLVARTLEREWEAKLRALDEVEQAAEEHGRQPRLVLTDTDRQAILALAADLPALWHAPTTTAADRKRLVRLVIQDVILDQGRVRGKLWFQLNWQTGATSEHWLVRRVQAYPQHADLERLQARVRALNANEQLDDAIAAALNAEGFQTARGQAFTGGLIWILRKRWGIPTVNPARNPERWPNGSYSVQSAARVLGVYPGTIFQWLRRGRLQGRQLGPGLPWQIPLTDDQIRALRPRARGPQRRS
ncbi:MAG: recombinase family protein [Chloroflexi bacterium]|nr:recombinase family protein [Chloroflexota bacterium]